jgi:diketogulonate reductase-like aldo/keto reductase
VPRDELFLASKCWTTTIHKGPEAVQAQLEKTLKDLGVDYIDLYCIHWPVPGKHVAAYQQLEKAQAAGLVRSLGVSNYAVEDFEELMESAAVVPAINQIEINPFLHRSKTIAFFESKGVKLQSYRSLRDGKSFGDPTVVAVAAKHGRSAAQVLGRWCVQHGYIYIPKSVKRERMAENMRVFDFELDADDMSKLDALTTPEALANFVAVRPHCGTQHPPRPAPPRPAPPRPPPPRPAPPRPASPRLAPPRPTRPRLKRPTECVRDPRRAQLYAKCVIRDTPDAGRTELVRTKLTVD